MNSGPGIACTSPYPARDSLLAHPARRHHGLVEQWQDDVPAAEDERAGAIHGSTSAIAPPSVSSAMAGSPRRSTANAARQPIASRRPPSNGVAGAGPLAGCGARRLRRRRPGLARLPVLRTPPCDHDRSCRSQARAAGGRGERALHAEHGERDDGDGYGLEPVDPARVAQVGRSDGECERRSSLPRTAAWPS